MTAPAEVKERTVAALFDATTDAMEELRSALADLKRRVQVDDDDRDGGRDA